MKVILVHNVDRLGIAGDVAEVKNGYARNYLLPQKLALVANQKNLAVYEEVRRQKEAQGNRVQREAVTLGKVLEKLSCTVSVASGEGDRIFGSITAQQISNLLKDQGVEVDRRAIVLDEPIRSLGVYDVPIQLHPKVEVKVKVWVVKE